MAIIGNYVCATHTSRDAPRPEIMAFRLSAFGDDVWDVVDNECWHLTVRDLSTGDLSAYYRILSWAELPTWSLSSISPMLQVFDLKEASPDLRVVELGRLCTMSNSSMTVMRALWTGVASLMEEIGAVKCFGMSTAPPDCGEIASKAFRCARLLAEDPDMRSFIPKVPLPAADDDQPQNAGQLRMTLKGMREHPFARLLSAYQAAGARFGPDAMWTDFGHRPCILTSMDLQRYLRRSPSLAGPMEVQGGLR